MNYLKLIKEFWIQHDIHSLETSDSVLYFYLLEKNNVTRWSNRFARKNIRIMGDLNISSDLLKKSRERLQEVGLIDFITQPGSDMVTYIFPESGEAKTEDFIKVNTENDPEVFGDKIIKTKTKIKRVNPLPPKNRRVIKGVDYEKILQLFNEQFKGKLSAITSLTPKRMQAVSIVIKQFGEDSIKVVFEKVLESPFLLGQNDKKWRCNFDWLFNSGNYIRVLEGTYQNYSNESSYPFTNQLESITYEQF